MTQEVDLAQLRALQAEAGTLLTSWVTLTLTLTPYCSQQRRAPEQGRAQLQCWAGCLRARDRPASLRARGEEAHPQFTEGPLLGQTETSLAQRVPVSRLERVLLLVPYHLGRPRRVLGAI